MFIANRLEGRYRDRLASICVSCFETNAICDHFDPTPLRLLLVGINPSKHAMQSGYMYANPSNRMTKLLIESQLVDEDYTLESQNELPSTKNIGFCDVGTFAGNKASVFTHQEISLVWSLTFYARLRAHVKQVNDFRKEQQIDLPVWCGEKYCGPKIIAFTGKYQFCSLFHKRLKQTVPYGKLAKDHPLPEGFPFDPKDCEVWILPSSSGRSVLSNVDRLQPYVDLRMRLEDL